MRLNLYWRGVDLLDVELHAGAKGLYLDLNVFQPRDSDEPEGRPTLTAAAHPVDVSRADGPVWADDQPAVVRLGFGT